MSRYGEGEDWSGLGGWIFSDEFFGGPSGDAFGIVERDSPPGVVRSAKQAGETGAVDEGAFCAEGSGGWGSGARGWGGGWRWR